MAASSDKEFQIGLAMSGAISAGAYTAGVFDFLVQALDEWEKARRGEVQGVDPETIPNHHVLLKVMSGASAGAITAAVGAVALADAGQKPESYKAKGEVSGKNEHFLRYLPKLYETWVEKPDLAVFDDLDKKPLNTTDTDFLDTIDFAAKPDSATDFSRTSNVPRPKNGTPPPVASLLNWRLLDDIANAAIDVAEVGKERSYVSERLHIYLTLSNLRGVPYKIPFDGGNYYMISHGDRVHYQVQGLGTWKSRSKFADNDKRRLLEAGWLASKDPKQREEWKDFSICALASAAFPVGLAPRDIGTTLDEYDGHPDSDKCYRHFPIAGIHDGAKIVPNWPASVKNGDGFWFRTADGGIIDNDPFEYAHFSLEDELDEQERSKLEEADRAVVMISPFPELRPIRPEGQPGLDIMSIFSALLPSLIDQARFKPSELVHAADEGYASRFLVGPSRVCPKRDAHGEIEKDKDGKVVWNEHPERYGIASGLLGGFGGFLSRGFRDHDYQLGRRNCQRFLRQAFALPAENKIFEDWPDAARNNPDFKAQKKPDDTRDFFTLIPLLGEAKTEVPAIEWEQFRISTGRFEVLLSRIGQRLDRLAPALLDQKVSGGLLRRLVQLAWITTMSRDNILGFVRWSILTDLVRRNQIEGWDLDDIPQATGLDPDDIRAILAELVNPAYDLRNAKGLLRAAREQKSGDTSSGEATSELTEGKVTCLMERLKKAKGKPYEVWEAPWKDKDTPPGALYALKMRLPWYRRPLGPRHSGTFFSAPRFDPPRI